MNRPRTSITSISLAFLVAACSSGNNSTSTQGSSGGVTGGNTSVSGGNPGGGSTSNPGGGSTSNPGGGSTSNPGGGSTSNPGGGSTGNPGGGSTGNPGGSTGNPGGSTGNPGGSTGNPGGKTGSTGGAAGGASGGVVAGGSTTTAAGGTTAGGGAATGGSSAAGAVSAGPAVYVSTNGSCVSGSGTAWTPGTIATSTGTATVTVSDTASQTWEGFGGCFNEKGWQALQALSSTDRDRAMQLLFGTNGTRFAMGRIPMGASDYALARYTDDEGSADTSMANFSTTQDSKNLIPFIQAALAVKSDIKFWASPWTPPTWMKTGPFTATTDDSASTTTNFDSGNMKDDATNLTAYAQYFVKFVAAYKAANINISIVAPQNEPNYALHYPSCIWTGALFTKFIGQYLGPALKDTGVGIMLGTMSNSDSGKDVDLGNAVLADATAKGFLKVAGVQWNVLDKVNGGTTFGGLPIWATEHKCGNYPWSGASGCGDGSSTSCPAYNSSKAPNDQAYGVESWYQIRNAIKKGKITAYNAWNMVLDTVGNGLDTHRAWNQDALLAVDTGSKALNVTSAYCVFRHFSEFVDVGAKVVGATGGDAVAFKNPDGSYVVVMYNSGSANSSYVVSVGGEKLQFSMPAAGWATVKVKP
jgi:glucosylceramidase